MKYILKTVQISYKKMHKKIYAVNFFLQANSIYGLLCRHCFPSESDTLIKFLRNVPSEAIFCFWQKIAKVERHTTTNDVPHFRHCELAKQSSDKQCIIVLSGLLRSSQ